MNKIHTKKIMNRMAKRRDLRIANQSRDTAGVDTVIADIGGIGFRLPCNKSQLYSRGGDRLAEISRQFRVTGDHAGGTAAVRVSRNWITDRATTRVTVSVPKFLSGQNVWAPGAVKPLFGRVFKEICQQLRLYSDDPDTCSLKYIKPRRVRLERVDLFRCYRLGSAKRVQEVIRHLYRMFGFRRKGQVNKYNSTYLRFSTRKRSGAHVVFYDKSRELESNVSRGGVEAASDLVPDGEGILKIEIRVEARELEALGLRSLNSWTEATASTVFNRFFADIVSPASITIPRMPVSQKRLNGLPPRMRPVYMLSALGVNLEMIYSPQTVRRHDSWFCKQGIAIRAGASGRTTKLGSILSRDRLLRPNHLPARILKDLGR